MIITSYIVIVLLLTHLIPRYQSISSFCNKDNGFFETWTFTTLEDFSTIPSDFFLTMKLIALNDVKIVHERHQEFSLCITSKPLSPSTLSGDERAALSERAKDTHPLTTAIINDIQHETDSSLSSSPLSFERCDVSLFDTTVVRGFPGLTDVTVRLFHHRREVLCQASVVVLCCEEDHPDIASSESAKSHLLTTFLTTSMSLLTSLPTPHRRHAPILSPPPPLPTDSTVVLEVVVGVKSFALNAEKRQSIRQNLQRRAQQYGDVVRLSFFFLVGWSPFVAEDPRVQHLLAEEKEVHGDVLLEEELPVEDNYLTLTDKVMTFLAWLEGGSDTRAKADFVVISDDDTYVSVPSLLTLLLEEKDKMRQAPRQYHWYAGEVLEDRLAHKFKPMRDPAHRNYLPAHLYPFTELPPFALGNFYILSSSLVHYFASQQHVLRSVGSLEDVSVGFWLQSLGVRAEDLRGVFHLTRWYHAFTFFSSLSPEDAWENPRLHLLAVSGLSRALSFQQLFEAEELSLDHYLIRAAAIGAIHHPSNTSLSLFDAMQRQYTMYREILSSLSQESSGESKGVRVDRLKNPHYLHDNQALTSLYRSLFTSQQPLRVVVVLASHCLKEVQYEGVQASQHLREHLLHLLQGESEVEVEVEVVVGGMLMSSEWFNFVQRQHIAVRFLSGLQNLSETNEHLLHLLSPSLSHYLSPISSEVSRGSLLHLRYLLSFDVVLVPLFPASSSSVEVEEVTQLVRMISFLQIYDRLHGNPTEDDIDDISSSLIIPLLLGGGEGVEEVCFEGVDRWFDRIFESLDSRELVYFLQLLSLPTSSNTSATASLHSLLLPQTLPLHCLPAQHNATTYYYEKLQRHNQDMTSSMDTSSREIRRRRRELSRVTLPRSFEQSPFTQRVEESALQQITVRTQRTVVVVGSDVSLYALSFLLSSLHHLLPSLIVDEVWVLISRQSPHFARMLRLRGFDQWIVDDDDADPVIAPLREVLQQRRSEGVSVLLLSTFLDCAVVAPRHTNKTPADSPSHTMRWEEGSDECFLSIKSVTSPDVTVWMHGEPNPLPRLLLERVEEVADVVFVCHSEHSLAYSLPPPRSTSHTTTYSTTSNTTSAFVSYLPTFATSFFEPSDEAEDEGSASTWQHHPLQLLDPVTTSTMEEEQWEWRVAYLYFNCDRRDRETFFSQLTSLLHNRSFSLPSSDREVRVTVEALGRCRGHGLEGMCEEEGRQYVRSRFSVNSSREAVAMYRGGGRGDGGSGRGFDYVIAMENDYVRDYVSEKLTNALLTQAIPIYIGAPNIHDYFHSSAFLSCSALSERPRTSDWVERCAEEVAQLILSRIRSGGRDVKRRQVWQGRTWRERFESFLSLFFFHPVTATASPYTRQWQRLFKNKLQRLYVSE